VRQRGPALLALLLGSGLPSRLFAQCPDGSPPPCRPLTPCASAGIAQNSVAVLYFDNLSPDTADAYLADGLTEEITSRLGELPRLHIKRPGRDAVRRLRDSVPDYLVALGRVLRVRYLVEGSVRRAGPRVRVSARLLGAGDGFRVWSADYDRAASDLLALQEEIAQQIATGIAGRLTPADRANLAARPTRSAEAYEHYLRGNHLIAERTPTSAARAIEEYRAALRFDPAFSRALGRIAYAYALFLQWGWEYPGVPSDSLLARGLTAVAEGLARDSTVSDTWMALGYLRTAQYPRALTGVLEAYERAIALDRFNAEALHQYGSALAILERDSNATVVLHQALSIEPQRPVTLWELSYIEFINRRLAASLHWADSVVAIDPTSFLGYEQRGYASFLLGDTAGARRDGEAAIRLGSREYAEALLAIVDAAVHDTASARARIERLRAAIKNSERLSVFESTALANALVAVGDTSAGLDALERTQPRGRFLWYGIRGLVGLQPSPRLERLIDEIRPQ